jgi:GAF domain-containing protein
VAAALEAAGTVAELRARNADLAALNRLADAATGAPDFASFLERAEEIVREATGCDGFGVLLVDAERRRGRLVHASRPPGATEEHARDGPLGELDVAALVAEERLQLRRADELREPAATEMRRRGVGTAIRIPLRFRSGTVGVLSVDFPGPPRDAAACRADLLQAMGPHFAAAIEAHRLLADLRRRVADLEAVNALALRVFTTPSGQADLLLDGACREIADALDAQAVVVLRATDDGGRLVGVAGWGTPLPAEEISIDLARSPVAAVALRR